MSSSLNGILGRIPYLARRLKDGGVAFVALKVREKSAQALFWPVCKLQRLGLLSRPASEVSGEFLRLGNDLAEAIASHYAATPQHRDAQRIRLQKINAGLFPVLGFGDLEIPGGKAWLTDQLSDVSWPDRYFPFIPLVYSDDSSDIKVVWELSRLQYLMWIAEAVVVTEGVEQNLLVTRFEQIVMGWDENNPCGYGPNWKCSMEVSIRSINLALSSAVIWKHLSDSARERITSMLAEHRRHLRKFPERSDVSGNHLLFDLIGEVVLDSVVFDAQKSLTRVLRDLDIELQSQFYEDGLHFENAVAYHRFVMEGLTLATAVLLRIGAVEQITPLLAVMNRGVTALRKLATVNCKLPVIGDCDSGQILAYSAPEQSITYVKELVMGGGRNAPILSAIAGDIRGRLAQAWLSPIDSESPERIGPYIRIRTPRADVLMRAGPHGLSGRATHDHDDNGSPWISFDGIDAIVERGCIGYTAKANERLEDIGSNAHNLVTIDGSGRFSESQGSIARTVQDAPVPRDATIQVEGASIQVVTTVAWQHGPGNAVNHERSIRMDDALIHIDDRIVVKHGGRCVLIWHVGPLWEVTSHEVSDGRIEFDSETHRMTLEVRSGDAPCRIEAADARYSPEYGARDLLTLVQAWANSDGSTSFTTKFRIFER